MFRLAILLLIIPSFIGATDIHTAIAAGDGAAVIQIVKVDPAQLAVRNADGDTPLLAAIMRNRVDIMLSLLDSGADMNGADADGELPLHRALDMQATAICIILRARGGKVLPEHVVQVGSVMCAPVRALATAIGATLERNPETGTIILTRDTIHLTLTPYAATATCVGQPLPLPVAPFILDEVLYVPLRVCATAFHHPVQWDAKAQQVQLTNMPIAWHPLEVVQMIQTDLDGDGSKEDVYAAYNNPHMMPPDRLAAYAGSIWVVKDRREVWRTPLNPEYLILDQVEVTPAIDGRWPVIHIRMFYNGSGVHYFHAFFRWDGHTYRNVLPPGGLDVMERGEVELMPATRQQPATILRYDFTWDTDHVGLSRYYAEWWRWNGTQFVLTNRKITHRQYYIAPQAFHELGIRR